MPKRVYKYPLQLTEAQTLKLPAGAKVLSVMNQREDIVLYALVDPERDAQNNWDIYRVYVSGTGQVTEPDATFLGTVPISGDNSDFVFHVFYRKL